jgi:signal transduction histidine kinase
VDWRDVAAELGFRALIALPLQSGGRVLGAATFYFREGGGFTSPQRDLLHVAAHTMALAAERALLTDQLRLLDARARDAEARAERQSVVAIEAARSRDEFLSNVSHELRTPLTIVLGTIDLLAEELGGPLTPAQHDDLRLAREASERLLGVVDTLLALSALRRGALPVVVESFEPHAPARDAVATAGSPAPGVQLIFAEPSTFIPAMRSDREKITRILSALLSNAIKFTTAGEIAVSVDVSGGVVRYRVRDTGPGIAKEIQPLVFDEFRQGDGSATRAHGGAGLGLPLARGLARLLRGDIVMESSPGAGSTFTVQLPVADSGASVRPL